MEILGFVVTADVSGLTQMNADNSSAYTCVHLRFKISSSLSFDEITCSTHHLEFPKYPQCVAYLPKQSLVLHSQNQLFDRSSNTDTSH
jgi:hypothetical protein